MDQPSEQSRAGLYSLMDGYLTTQLLCVAAELGVAEALADRPRDAAALADELSVDAGALRRVLRGLAASGVLIEHGDGRFGLAELGELLRDGPGSLRGPVLARRLYYRAAERLLDTVRDGRTAFEAAFGMPFFDYLAARPAEGAAFQASMAGRSVHESAAVVAAYDFGRFRRLVDVGGGQGILLSAVLSATPGLSGVLFDRPDVVATARLPAGCATVGGDFFDEVPAGGDAYLLSRVIHNWDDADAVRILARCRAAMPDGAVLLLVEAVQPERAADQPGAVRMDLNMLLLLTGRERTAAEYAALLSAAGLTLHRVIPTAAPDGVHVLEAVPSPTGDR